MSGMDTPHAADTEHRRADAAPPAEDAGRDSRGRFTCGNPGGPGNPHRPVRLRDPAAGPDA